MASFRQLADNLGRLSTIASRIAAPITARINDLIATQFANGQDPYGRAWAPLLPQTIRRKGGDTRILIRSGSLGPATIARPARGSGIELVSTVVGGFHQTGTRWMVPRETLPDRAELPVSWQAIIREEYARAFGAR